MCRKQAGIAVRKDTLIDVKAGQALDGHRRSDSSGVGTPKQRPRSAQAGSKEWISAQAIDYMNPIRLFQGLWCDSSVPAAAVAESCSQTR